MQSNVARIVLTFFVAFGVARLAAAVPVVTSSTSLNIGGSGFDAIDFYYASSPGAEFSNYRLNLETTNGAFVHDPLARQLQNPGSESIDTFMNTVGSFLDLGNATQIQNVYKAGGIGGDTGPISRIDWSVYDMLAGDTNDIGGDIAAPFHLARVLVDPAAQWNATFSAYDTLSNGKPSAFNFTNNPQPVVVAPVITPPSLPPSVIDHPVVQPPSIPQPQPVQSPVVIVEPPLNPHATGLPVVTSSTTHNIGGSGFDAIDFFYASSPGAEFSNYRLNLETTNGAFVHDPEARQLQNPGSESIDTFMNTVGSFLGVGNATQIQNAGGIGSDTGPISRIDWSVYDMLTGDTNEIGGSTAAPFHLARVLVAPAAQWNATFSAYDTLSNGKPSAFRFTNNPQSEIEPPASDPPVTPELPFTGPVHPPVVIVEPAPAPHDPELPSPVGPGDSPNVWVPFPHVIGKIIGWPFTDDPNYHLIDVWRPVAVDWDGSSIIDFDSWMYSPDGNAIPILAYDGGNLLQFQRIDVHTMSASQLLTASNQFDQSHPAYAFMDGEPRATTDPGSVPEPTSAALTVLAAATLFYFARSARR